MDKKIKMLLEAKNIQGLENLQKIKAEYRNYIFSYMKNNFDFLVFIADQEDMEPEEYLVWLKKTDNNISYYQDIVDEIYAREKVERQNYIKQLGKNDKLKERNK